MTVQEPALQRPEPVSVTHFVAADRLVRPLASLGLTATIVATATIFVESSRLRTSWLPALHASGLLGLAAGSVALSALGLVGCLCMVLFRRRQIAPRAGLPTNVDQLSRTGTKPGYGWPQTVITLVFAAAAGCAVIGDWPLPQSSVYTATPSGAFAAAGTLLILATPWLLIDRYFSTVSADRLPEVDDLRALLFLPVFFLLAEAILQLAAAVGFGTFHWVHIGLASVLLLICAELAVRVVGNWFLPPPDSDAARARITSLVASALRGRALSPASMAGLVRSQFGMDFSRSWALRFMRASALPVVLLMLVFCWFLTGVTRIDMNERGSYERFGTVATILQPGLHLVLPLPFGVVRHLGLGVMHSVLVGINEHGATMASADTSTAEGDPPSSANRLWDSEQPFEVSYIIASSEQNRQSFQTVSASVRVLYRLGMTDSDARAALYRIADPDALVRSLSGRLLAQFFAGRTLPVVLGEDQGVIAADLRTRLRHALQELDSGIDIVAVTIEAIHPPSGAASAYRNVQAAEIAATTSIATEQGRAQTTKSVAQRDAHSATDDASATAAETVSAARVDLTDMTADDQPYRTASQPFLLERYFSDMKAALANIPLQIIDHRLTGASLPTIDLRPPGTVRDSSPGGLVPRENTP